MPLFPNDQFATFILSATIGSFAVELVYLILAVVAFRLVRASGNKWWQYADRARSPSRRRSSGSTARSTPTRTTARTTTGWRCTGRSG